MVGLGKDSFDLDDAEGVSALETNGIQLTVSSH